MSWEVKMAADMNALLVLHIVRMFCGTSKRTTRTERLAKFAGSQKLAYNKALPTF